MSDEQTLPEIYERLVGMKTEGLEWSTVMSNLSDLPPERAEEVACVMYAYQKENKLSFTTKHPFKAAVAKGGSCRYKSDSIPEGLRVLLTRYISSVTSAD